MLDDKGLTRDVVKESPVDHDWLNKMFENFHRAIFLNESFKADVFWESIAFYNFVQRPMDYTYKERPSYNDFYKGWSVFLSVIDILKPTDCIFIGVAASNTFSQSMSMLGADAFGVEWLEGQGASARRFTIRRNWGDLTPICIRHTSSYFSYEWWHEFLLKHCKPVLKSIYSIQGLQLNNADTYPAMKGDKEWVKDIPIWLKHKPILASNYCVVNDDGSDARFLTLGRAQYDNENSASVKMWRYSEDGNRWSRQSEEVPISRITDMALMLVSAIKTLKTLDYRTGFTYLKEDFVNEDDMPFIKKCIDSDSPRIKKSLSELKRLLNDIDIDSI